MLTFTQLGAKGSGLPSGGGPTPNIPPPDCNAFQAQLSPAQAALENQVAKIEQASTAWRDANAPFFDKVALASAAVGTLQGKVDACRPVVGSIDALKKQFKANTRDMILIAAKLTAARVAGDYTKWLILRTKLQTYKRVIAKVSGWIVKATAAAAAEAAVRAQEQADAKAQADADAAAKAAQDAADAAAAGDAEALVTAAEASASLARTKTAARYLGIGLVVLIGGGLAYKALSRRKA